jgi:hypothetical protein
MKIWLPGMLLACSLISPLYSDSAPGDLHPDPKFSPQEVVEFQLTALRANDVPTAEELINALLILTKKVRH